MTTQPIASLQSGAKSGIGTTPVSLASSGIMATNGIQIRAAPTNTGIVYIGTTDITAGTSDDTDGYPLSQGDSVFVPVRNLDMIRVVASAAGQKVFYLVL